MIKKYRKRPVVIEAIQFDGSNSYDLHHFAGDYLNETLDHLNEMFVETLEGKMRVNIGDFVIKGTKGEFYPCREDIFKETYVEA